MPCSPRARQGGLSMIELMIALALSAFLILGVTQLYIDGKTRYLYFSGQSENQDNGRYALQLLEGRLAKAGYRRLPSTTMAAAFPAATSNSCTFTAGQALVRVDASTICLRYQPRDNTDRDCTGGSLSGLTGVSTPYTTFSTSQNVVEKITLSSGSLTCNGTTLVDNVSAVYFDYGVDSGTDESSRKVAQYVASPGSGVMVRSLRYALLMASSRSGASGGMANTACDSWKTLTGNTLCSASDTKLYRIFSSTTMLRNLMP